jgi:hypothetical protein
VPWQWQFAQGAHLGSRSSHGSFCPGVGAAKEDGGNLTLASQQLQLEQGVARALFKFWVALYTVGAA